MEYREQAGRRLDILGGSSGEDEGARGGGEDEFKMETIRYYRRRSA